MVHVRVTLGSGLQFGVKLRLGLELGLGLGLQPQHSYN